MKFLMFLALIFVVGCSNQNHETIQYGKTDKDTLIKQFGQPDQTRQNKNENLLYYEDTTYIIDENNKVKAQARDPLKKERTILYWQELWKKDDISEKEVQSKHESHGEKEYQLINLRVGMTVIFSKPSGKVSRVYDY